MRYHVCVGQQPSVATLGSVGTIFVRSPNESIFYGGVKLDVNVIDETGYQRREVRVQNLSVRTIGGEHIFNCQVQVVDVYVRRKRHYETKGASRTKPKGRTT